MIFTTRNPATEAILNEYQRLTDAELEQKLTRASQAFLKWKDISFEKRGEHLNRLSEILLKHKESLADLITHEMGKVRSEALAEIEKCSLAARFFADNGENFLQKPQFEVGAQKAFVSFEPLGVLFGIMPWNFPFWQVLRFAIPSLQAGNVIVLKHAPNTFGCNVRIEELLLEAGFPQGVFQSLVIDLDQSSRLIADPRVRGISLTGSTEAGRQVAAQAGRYLKKCVLELGGSDPYLILEDANLDLAAKKCGTSRLQNAGQSCVAAKRFLIEAKVYEPFKERLLKFIQDFKVGDPTMSGVKLGPLARGDLRDKLKSQVAAALKSGAKKIFESEYPKDKGYFHPVLVLEAVNESNPAFKEELFGPVFSLIRVDMREELIRLANASPYGLGAAIFSEDREQAEKLAQSRVDSGMVFVNDLVRSTPEMPFGGVRDSGFGRELSLFGIQEFVNIKTVAIY